MNQEACLKSTKALERRLSCDNRDKSKKSVDYLLTAANYQNKIQLLKQYCLHLGVIKCQI